MEVVVVAMNKAKHISDYTCVRLRVKERRAISLKNIISVANSSLITIQTYSTARIMANTCLSETKF